MSASMMARDDRTTAPAAGAERVVFREVLLSQTANLVGEGRMWLDQADSALRVKGGPKSGHSAEQNQASGAA